MKLIKEETWNEYNSVGMLYFRLDKYKKSISYYKKAIKLDCTKSETYRGIAMCYFTLREYDDAIKYFTKFIELDNGSSFSYSKRAECYVRMEDYKNAIDDYTKCLEEPDALRWYYEDRAECYYKLGDYDSAIKDYNASMIPDMENTGKHYMIARCYQRMGNIEKAKDCLYECEVNELKIGNQKCFIKKDSILDSIKMISCFLKEKERGGDYACRADKYVFLDDYTKAIEDYNRALELGYTSCYKNIAMCYYWNGNYDKAIEYFIKAVEKKDRKINKYQMYKKIAVCYKEKGDIEKAKDYLYDSINLGSSLYCHTLT